MPSQTRFCVITRVPEANDMGNLATAVGSLFVDPQISGAGFDTNPRKSLGEVLGNPAIELYIHTPVFTIGEILIVNEDGREKVGKGRKPAKWDVGYETFDSIEGALLRAHEVMFS